MPNFAPSDTPSDTPSEPATSAADVWSTNLIGILKVQTTYGEAPPYFAIPHSPRVFVELRKTCLEPEGTCSLTRSQGYSETETQAPKPTLTLGTCLRIPTQILPQGILHGICNADSLESPSSLVLPC